MIMTTGCPRWLAAPYQAMLRRLGQAPASVQEQLSTELLVDGTDVVPEVIRASASEPSVALLIDGENCAPEVAAHALTKASEFGTVRVRRVYANWSVASTRGWIEPVARYAIQPIHHEPTATGKNATDILLTIDAIDLLHTHGVDCFCLVASDSDYTPLVVRLRAAQCTVVVIGRAKTFPALVAASSVFIRLEELIDQSELPASRAPLVAPPSGNPAPKPAQAAAAPKPAKGAAPPSSAPAAKPAKGAAPPSSTPAAKPAKGATLPSSTPAAKPAKGAVPPSSAPAAKPAKGAAPPSSTPAAKPAVGADLGPLLIAVWEDVRQARGAVSFSDFVNAIKQRYPSLQPQSYGHTRLAQLVKSRTDLFTLNQDTSNPAHVRVLRAALRSESPEQPGLPTLLETALRDSHSQDGWIFMGVLGHQLKQIDPTFTPKKYGYARLGLLLQSNTEICELRQRDDGMFDVRLKR